MFYKSVVRKYNEAIEQRWANLGTPIIEIFLLVLRLLESSSRLLVPDPALCSKSCGEGEGGRRLDRRLRNIGVMRFGILWREPAKSQVGRQS